MASSVAVGPPEIPPIPVGPVNMSHEQEKLVVCPYNPAHSILTYRLQVHLHRCRRQHESLDWGSCSHNTTHQMPRVELEHHEKHLCPDRHSFQSKAYTFATQEHKSLAPIEHIELPELEESWEDCQINTFDPKKNASDKSLIRGVHCVPPSERKKFKLQHRRHIQERDGGDEFSMAKPKVQPPKPKEQIDHLEPLRPPKELPKGFVLPRGSKTQVPQSPGVLSNLENLSLEEDTNRFTPGPSVQWSGLGRGRVAVDAAPVSLPRTNAWGRGKSLF